MFTINKIILSCFVLIASGNDITQSFAKNLTEKASNFEKVKLRIFVIYEFELFLT